MTRPPDASHPSDAAGPNTLYGWVAFTCVVLLLVTDRLMTRGDHAVLHALGTVSLVVAPVFFVPPFLLLPRYGRRVGSGPYYATTRVVDRGLYAIVRHPQYLGYMLLAVGFALLSQRAITMTLGTAAVVLFWLHARREEAYCLHHLGHDYRDYMQRVPRFNAVRGAWRHARSRFDNHRS